MVELRNGFAKIFMNPWSYFIFFAAVALLMLIPGLFPIIRPISRIALFWAFILFYKDMREHKRILQSDYAILMLLFIAFYFVTVLLTDSGRFFNYFTSRAHTFFMVALFYAYNPFEDKFAKLRGLCVATKVLSGLTALMMLLSFPLFIFLIERVYIGSISIIGVLANRLFGLFTEPNHGSAYAGICLILAILCIYIEYNDKGKINKYLVVVSVVNYIGVVLSRSRSGTMGLAVAVIVAAFFLLKNIPSLKTKVRHVFATLLCLLLFMSTYYGNVYLLYRIPENIANLEMLPQSEMLELWTLSVDTSRRTDDSINDLRIERVVYGDEISSARFGIWGDAIRVWQQHPVFGIGRMSLPEYVMDNMHLLSGDWWITQHNGNFAIVNVFLEVLVSSGIVGFVLYVGFLGLCALKILKYLFAKKENSLDYVVVVILFALLGQMTTVASLTATGFLTIDFLERVHWMVLGMAMYFVSKDTPQRETILMKLYIQGHNFLFRQK